MITENMKRNPLRLLEWQKRNVAFYGVTATAAWALVAPLGFDSLLLPVMPITIVGSAIGIFTSFRANQAYDRWWEGRKLWGRLINTSRHISDQFLRYTRPEDKMVAERMVLRHVTYVHALRCLLRKEDPFEDPDFNRHLRAENVELKGSTNLTHALLDRQLTQLVELNDNGLLDAHRLESLDRSLMDLLNIQGGCERIKGTPLPRGYGFIAETMINLFAILLPFALVDELGAGAIPMSILVCLAFALISEAGRVLEDPFSLFYNGLPLHNLSIKIEQNVRERIGHTDLPPTVVESRVGVLM